MNFSAILRRFRHPDLQGKIILILIGVIFPVSILLGLAQSKVMEPVLSEEVRQVGLSFAENLSAQIRTERLFQRPKATELLEDKIQKMIYAQPSIIRVDIIARNLSSGELYYLASSIEEPEAIPPSPEFLKDKVEAEVGREDSIPVWRIFYPIRNGPEQATIRVLLSLRFVSQIQETTLKINLIAALLSTFSLILILSFLLRRAIINERQLRVAQRSNEELSGKLQEIQQELIHTEKLAVMGQLTASFAHEIGTPLNAIGGHLQLLDMNLDRLVPERDRPSVSDRMGIISGQIRKIEDIVKGFLQTTKKPIAQRKSEIPARDLIEKVLHLLEPTFQRHQILFETEYLANADHIEVVPLEIEQVILNLMNNAIDSMKEKTIADGASIAVNELHVRTTNTNPQSIIIEIEDSGTGISEQNLKQIFKPFFTTKGAGEGHGLGLSICQEIVRSYGGELHVESEVGKGTKMKVELPLKRGPIENLSG